MVPFILGTIMALALGVMGVVESALRGMGENEIAIRLEKKKIEIAGPIFCIHTSGKLQMEWGHLMRYFKFSIFNLQYWNIGDNVIKS